MGSWGSGPFDNDIAMDWIGDLGEAPASERAAMFSRVLADIDEFERRRLRGLNTRTWTAQEVENDIRNCKPPLRGKDAESFRKLIGKTLVDIGSIPVARVVAAAAVMVAARAGCSLPEDLVAVPAKELTGGKPLVRRFIKALRAIPENRDICRANGAAWKRKVGLIADELEAGIGPATTPAKRTTPSKRTAARAGKGR
jgi:hypothetical protein